MRKGWFMAGAAIAALGLTPTIAHASSGGGPVAQDLVGSGSDTTQFMMHAIDGIYLFSPGCQQLKFTNSQNQSIQPEDFSCQSPDPAGTITTENYAHDQVHEAYFLGSGGGIQQLCQVGGTPPYAPIAWARSSRVPSSSDCSGLDFVAYARDGISWEAFDDGTTASGVDGMNNNQNPDVLNNTNTCVTSGFGAGDCLSQAQLQAIYKCQINNWSQVGGQNVPIVPYLPPTSSGTEQTFAQYLGFQPVSTQSCTIKSTPENSNATIVSNGDRAGAIAPFSYGIWKTQVHGRDNAVLGAIDGVNPTAGSISNGSFPYGRFLFNVICVSCAAGNSPQAAVNYVGPDGWICKPTGQHATDPVTLVNFRTDISNAISASGFVPIALGPVGGGDPNSDYCRLTTH
ncbi:MAG: substrate-binding domain-containing protein [Candidatus Dormibacteraeota bacterium]|nr:substrate-binding domain-containing protein [Candidatus Dormibacteraeota bacterium]